MAFSQPTVTHSFTQGTQQAATGTIEWSLLDPMTNGSVTLLPPSSIIANLSSGAMSQAITSNIDPGTVPAAPWNATWRVDIQVTNAQLQSYFVTVPPIQTELSGSTTLNSKTVQLSSLTAADFMIGQSITGTNIPSTTIITAVNTTLNQVSISNAASGTGSALSLTLGATVDLEYLLPGEPQAG